MKEERQSNVFCEENLLFHLKKEIRLRKHLLLKTDQNGWNVIHFAAKGGNLRIFQYLQSETLDVGSKTHDQITVLHIATQSGHLTFANIF